jgi:hypothetical protein
LTTKIVNSLQLATLALIVIFVKTTLDTILFLLRNQTWVFLFNIIIFQSVALLNFVFKIEQMAKTETSHARDFKGEKTAYKLRDVTNRQLMHKKCNKKLLFGSIKR